jgi:hypothetical protein
MQEAHSNSKDFLAGIVFQSFSLPFGPGWGAGKKEGRLRAPLLPSPSVARLRT